MNKKTVTISRKAHFNAAHRLFLPEWSEEQNFAYFGKCANPNYHGHNYDLVVSLTGEIDAKTGFVYDMKKLKDLIEVEIAAKLDHKNLNLEVKPFDTVVPTAENIAVYIWDRLRKKIEPNLNLKVRLYETPRNFVDYAG